MEFAPLHEIPEFQKECAEVLNEEWKRSLAARLHSLEKSRDSFPVCLVMLERAKDGKQHVIAHSMLSVVRGLSVPSCLVESVVVRKSHRGKGYGRTIMQKSEEFAARKGYKVMYLTTHDKQKFYEHIGYEYCSPVVTCSADILPEQLANKLISNLAVKTQEDESKQHIEKSGNKLLTNPVKSEINISNSDSDIKAPAKTCKKNTSEAEVNQAPVGAPIPSPPMAPPPPPVAPPPPPPTTNSRPLPDKTGDKQVSRWDPSCVSWMKKRIV